MTSSLDLPMTVSEARQVTQRINRLIGQIAESTEKVVGLIEQAKVGRAWEVLGHKSWTAYVTAEFADALRGLSRAERVPISAKLSDTGLSVRSVGEITGVGVSTAHTDIVEGRCSGPEHLDPEDSTTGTDGKSYPRPATFLRSGKPDARSTEEIGAAAPPPKKQARRRPLPDAYWRATYDLERVVERLQRLHADDRFPGNRERLRTGTTRSLSDVASMLGDLSDDLGGVHRCSDCDTRIVPSWDDRHFDRCGDCR